ncbi:hypothetical protein PVAP13_7KG112620 [Panicum virgatum]|uniref:Uncharacterized protein n=1 Tax=Panicum virgatum TaxID=38727 RepID=A0A8T0QH19_PANVG|nr:hypothetical protein PVAP13_7KG112620 [Panicum virgatum]
MSKLLFNIFFYLFFLFPFSFSPLIFFFLASFLFPPPLLLIHSFPTPAPSPFPPPRRPPSSLAPPASPLPAGAHSLQCRELPPPAPQAPCSPPAALLPTGCAPPVAVVRPAQAARSDPGRLRPTPAARCAPAASAHPAPSRPLSAPPSASSLYLGRRDYRGYRWKKVRRSRAEPRKRGSTSPEALQ